MEPVLDTPVRADDHVQAIGRQGAAEPIVGRFDRGFRLGFATTNDLADGFQAGPAMIGLPPVDRGGDGRGAGLDPAVIPIDGRLHRGGRAGRIVGITSDIVMQRALIALQGRAVVTLLIDYLLGDCPMAVQRIGGHDRAFQRSIFSKAGTAVKNSGVRSQSSLPQLAEG